MINKCFAGLIIMLALVMILGGLSPMTVNAAYPVLMLDISNRNVAAQTESGFTSFTIADSGSVVDGITVELAGSLDARWRGAPTGIPYELIYRDFIFSRPGGMTVTLSGLEANKTYEITIYAYDTSSAGDRIADWTANEEYILTTSFTGGQDPSGYDDNAFTGTAQSDANGTLVLECGPGEGTAEESGANNPYGFMNALVVSSMTPITKARYPEPADGVLHSGTGVVLSWTPGGYASSHDVYLGDNFTSVDSATTADADIFLGSTNENIFMVGSSGSPYPDGLSPGTTYYWRIDEVNDLQAGSPWKGDVWSFTVPSKTAFNPVPVNGVMFADPNGTLQWIQGADSVLHRLFFGDNLEDVEAGTGGTAIGPVSTTTYDPGLLEYEKTYYWRIDEFDGRETHKGDVWSFTTTSEVQGTVVMDMWEDIAGSTLNLLQDSPSYPDNPTWSDVLTDFATDDSIGDNYGARIHGWLYVPLTGDYTFFFSSADEGELWLSTDDDPTNVQLLASEPVWGSYDTFSRKSDPVSLVGGNRYYIMAVWKEGADWDHCQVAWRGAGIPEQQIIQGNYLSPYEPINAFGSIPSDSAEEVRRAPVLGWKPGKHASSHDIYLGTDQEAVQNADTASPEYKGTQDLGTESFDPGDLEFETTYYWRIDEVNDLNPDSPWVGEVWSFTIGNFLIVDDFEDYNDYDPDQIFNTWLDGWEDQTNGAIVGHDVDAAGFLQGEHIVETTIVHGDMQSMPYYYTNVGAATYSLAERPFSPAQDWTQEGITELSLWFRGYPASVGSFTEGPLETITMTGSGTDITGQADEFHFAYKMLTGVGSITARVLSLDNTDPWAKAGVMIRESLEPGSKHAFVCVTPGNGVAFEGRINTDGASFTSNQTEITAPHWVKLERDISGDYRAYHSTDGSTWVPVENSTTQSIQMGTSYIGLAVTSHNAGATCEAQFSDVTITGNVTQQQWMSQDIGITSNDPEPMYVVLNGSAVVYHDNPDASVVGEWTEWRIDLQAFSDQGVNLTGINSLGIGIGNQDGTASGDSGIMFFDDLRLYRPGNTP